MVAARDGRPPARLLVYYAGRGCAALRNNTRRTCPKEPEVGQETARHFSGFLPLVSREWMSSPPKARRHTRGWPLPSARLKELPGTLRRPRKLAVHAAAVRSPCN